MDKKALIEKLHKIHRLSEQGVAGEKESASVFVEKLMTKYGITESELQGEEEPDVFWFRFDRKDLWAKKMLGQVIYSVMGTAAIYKSPTKETKYGVLCTKTEAVEIEAKYEFYYAAMVEDMQTLYTAFLYKNDLFPPKTKLDEAGGTEEHDDKDSIDIDRVVSMMRVLDKRDYFAQLT